MKRTVLFALGTCAMALTAPAAVARTEASRPHAGATADARARETLARMTLDEKLTLLSGSLVATVVKENPGEKRLGAGRVPGIPRLGVPGLWETDASLGVAEAGGVRKDGGSTALPAALATASTFDPALARAGGAMIGSEARAKGFNVLLAGGVNLVRDPWAGRNFEYFSEDPLLSGVLAGASIEGVQSNGIVSTIKHYALNSQETGRYVMDAVTSRQALRQSDLLAFEIGIERGRPGSVMCAYNKVLGDWACENDWLLNKVLKSDWNFRGWVMSDWGAVHSTEKAALAGLDQQSGREGDKTPFFVKPLRDAVSAGRVPMRVIDDKALRILRMMYEHGLVDNPPSATPSPIDFAANAAIAQRVAEAGIVLLKNDGPLLPLASVKRVAVIGGHADAGVMSGSGSSQVAAVGGGLTVPVPGMGPFTGLVKMTYHASSPLKAIAARVGAGNATYASGEDIQAAVEAARKADVAVVFVDEWRNEGIDRESLRLAPAQDALVEAVITANPRTVIVLETGGPVLMPWLSKAGAVIEAWYSGQRGGEAIARVLFGEVNPSGHLPVTFPASADQPPRPSAPGLDQAKAFFDDLVKNPPKDLSTVDFAGAVKTFQVDYVEGADVGYRWYAAKGLKPAFAFGHGLSYTDFSYGKLTLKGGNAPAAKFRLRNTGGRDGAEVAQVYAAASGQVPRLVGFARVDLAQGEQRTIVVPLDWRPLSTWDEAAGRWVPPSGPIAVSVGGASDAIRLRGTAMAM